MTLRFSLARKYCYSCVRVRCADAGGVAAEVADVDLNAFAAGSIVEAVGAAAYEFVVLPNRYCYLIAAVAAELEYSFLVDYQQVQMEDRLLWALQD